MLQLRPYQEKGIDLIAQKYSQGTRKIVFQLPTGGGKTVAFAGLINRYLQAVRRKVLIVVHRDELLNQSKKTLYKWYGLAAEPVVAGVKYIKASSDVYVAMVETANNRLKVRPDFFGDIGMVIIDEAHLGNFKKLHSFFTDQRTLIIGFTATPISAVKKFPLNSLYEDIVCSIDIPDLIAQGALVPNRTYYVKSVNRSRLKVKNGEFDNAEMGAEFSKLKHVYNTVEGYEKNAPGTKAIVFNCSKAHSELVCKAFLEKGYNAKHLDSDTEDGELPHQRGGILKWFHETPGAILCNIGILTTGFDEETIETVVVNRATKSLPLWLQMTGRGSRPSPGKRFFTILDMGDNWREHGDWCRTRDWDYIFRNPAKPSKGDGVAPIKDCTNCGAIISASASVCQFCGVVQPVPEPTYDKNTVEFQLLEHTIDVGNITQQLSGVGFNIYSVLHQINYLIVQKSREQSADMSPGRAYGLLEVYQHKVEEWCRSQGKKYDQWHKETSAQWFFKEVKRVFSWEPERLSIAL